MVQKHPLNRRWCNGWGGKWEWCEDLGIYRRQMPCHKECFNYCLGERLIDRAWWGYEVDEFLVEVGYFYENAFEWLRGARYKEYGCKLFEKEEC